MVEAEVRRGTQNPIPEIDVLWITAGLGCDGDTIAMTAATQPSIEDILLGAIPWIPKVTLHNPFLALANGDDFPEGLSSRLLKGRSNISFWWSKAPFRTNTIRKKATGPPWARTRRPASRSRPVNGSIVSLPNAWAVVAAGTCATYGGIHAMEGNPTGCMGLPDYLGWKWKSKAEIPIVCVPGCPVQPDNFMETLLYLLYMAAGRAPMIPLDEALRPTWLFGNTVHEGCDRGGYLRAGAVCRRIRISALHCEAGMLGTGGAVQRWKAGMDGRHRRMSRTSAASASDAPCPASLTSSCRL